MSSAMSPEDSRLRVRTLIVDDEPLARTNLRILLRRYPQVEIVGEPGSGLKAVEQIRATKPDLLFLDIQMPECDGFDVLEMLGGDVPPGVIFVTAYDRHAIRAFDAGALDYLLKPFDNARFERALSRALDKIQRHRTAAGHARLIVRSAGQILFLQTTDIDWIEAADYYASLHVGDRTHLLRRSLSALQRDLDPAIFCRVHRSAIVNLARVRAFQFNPDGEFEVLLENGSTLPVSRRYRRHLQLAAADNQRLVSEATKHH
ncbi:MAG TPA: LytTR family DNA-binding domain-containing protein [Bryobacteraceae bacterium]|nr:LytTR family DNA-binding domain-containing protein [Bryobacteraceae bacterium]